jgi:hypothetical protein
MSFQQTRINDHLGTLIQAALGGVWAGDPEAASARAAAGEALETIAGETVFRGLGRGNFGSYRAGMFEHIHIALGIGPAEVCGVRDCINRQCMAQVARFGQNSEDPEDN